MNMWHEIYLGTKHYDWLPNFQNWWRFTCTDAFCISKVSCLLSEDFLDWNREHTVGRFTLSYHCRDNDVWVTIAENLATCNCPKNGSIRLHDRFFKLQIFELPVLKSTEWKCISTYHPYDMSHADRLRADLRDLHSVCHCPVHYHVWTSHSFCRRRYCCGYEDGWKVLTAMLYVSVVLATQANVCRNYQQKTEWHITFMYNNTCYK